MTSPLSLRVSSWKSLLGRALLPALVGLVSSAAAPPQAEPPPVFAKTTGSITGTVAQRNSDQPLPSVVVVLRGTRFSGFTDANGVFTMRDVPPGSYLLLARSSGFDPANDSVTVIAGETAKVKLELRPRRTAMDGLAVLSGRITGQGGAIPVRHAHVQLPGTQVEAVSDDKGFFSLYGIVPGAHEVRLSALGYESASCSLRVEEGRTTIIALDLGSSLLAKEKEAERPSRAARYRPLGESENASRARTVDARDGIRFTLPDTVGVGGWAPVSLEIEDGTGQLVRRLVSWELPSGDYSVLWDGKDDAGRAVAPGSYRWKLGMGRSAVEGLVSIR